MLNFKTAALVLLASASQVAIADDATVTAPAAPAVNADVDNTAMNKRDQDDATLTPMDQAKGSKHDVELTRQIRQRIMKDKAMSGDAKNVKIITIGGKTTLRGPVESLAEKNRLSSHAAKIVGAAKVDNQLEVKASN